MLNYVTKENIKPGMLLLASGGATMRWNDFYQVISIKGTRVILGAPITGHEGNQEGYDWIEAVNPNPTPVRYAKFTSRGLQLCGKPGQTSWDGKDVSWRVGYRWGGICIAEIGKKEHFYGD